MWCSVALAAAALPLLLLAGAAAWTLVFAWWRPKLVERSLRRQGLNGTRYRFLFGDAKEIFSRASEAKAKPMPLSHDVARRIAPFFVQAAKEYGSTFITWFGPVPRLIVGDPELIKEVMANKHGHFANLEARPPRSYLTPGFANFNGEKWAKHRKIVNPAFLQERLKSMMPAFSTPCLSLLDQWQKLIGTKDYMELDVWNEFQNLTRDVISRTAFGSSHEEGKRIFELQDEQARIVVEGAVKNQIPGYRFLPTKANRRGKEINREVQGLLRGIVEKRLKAIKSGVNRDDLLGFLLKSSLTETQESGNCQQMALTTDEVIDECILFYFVGQETTSNMLTWALVALSMNPTWQERAREEVLQVFEKRHPDFDGLSQLKIVNMVLYEVLRLYPQGWLIPRRITSKTKLGRFTLPDGVLIGVPTILLHHDPNYWGEDANEFNPGRFQDGISRASKCQNVYLPFGAGPRICVGQNFALLEGKLILSMMLQRFSFELSPSYAHAPHVVISLQPQHGAPVIFRKL